MGPVLYLYCNIRSVNNKLLYIEQLLTLHNPHVICFTETWLSSNTPNSILPLDLYNVFRFDRTGRGGGCLIAVENTLKCLEIQKVHITSEIIGVDIYTPKATTRVICCYCPPNISCIKRKKFYSELNSFMDHKYRLIIFGDFNIALENSEILSHSNIVGLDNLKIFLLKTSLCSNILSFRLVIPTFSTFYLHQNKS